jgi:hypothetical protein
MSDDSPVDPATASAPAPAAAARAKSRTRFITPALALVAALVIGGVAGVFIGQSTAPRGPSAMGGPGAFVPREGGPQVSGGPEGDFTAGTIESIDGDTITVKLDDGTTVTVTTDDDTSVTELAEVEVGDLAEGDEITVIGEKDADGNVAADSISQGAFMVGGPETNSSQ